MADDFITTFMADKDKVTLTENDILDRVINLKLYTVHDGSEKDEYVIRSDFELYYPDTLKLVAYDNAKSFYNSKKCFIRKCQNKPSIKVQYKRVSLSSSIEVDIFIRNFFMLDKDGNLISGFNNKTYKLSRVDFAMGYFGQFKALFSNQTPKSPDELFTKGFLSSSDSEPDIGHGITVMSMSNVEYSQLDSLPPDMSFHIHGYVGNTVQYNVDLNSDDFPSEYDKLMKSQAVIPAELKKGKDCYLDQVYYETITRNWIKKGTLPKLESTQIASGKEYTTGVMSVTDADKYGIKVYLSKGMVNYSKEKEASFKKGADGKVIKPTLAIPKASTAEGKMKAISNYFGLKEARFTLIDSLGDYVVYLEKETKDIEEMLKGTSIGKMYEKTSLAKTWKNCIPAVYNITNDKLCTIVCPFFCFINPFEKLKFKSRYALGGLVSYYANYTNVNKDEFYVLWQNVSFATEENINECTIVCTGQKKRR